MLMAQDGTNSARTRKVVAALNDLKVELDLAGKTPADVRNAAVALAEWVGEKPHGIRRSSIASKATTLLLDPLSFALLGYVDWELIRQSSMLSSGAIDALRTQVREARQFLPDVYDASAHLDGTCDALLALSFFFDRVSQVRRSGVGLVSDYQGGVEVSRTRKSLTGQEYCDYCHRPSQIYEHVHGHPSKLGLNCVSGPASENSPNDVRALGVDLSGEFCSAHVGGSSNRWSKAGARSRERAQAYFRSYREMLSSAGLFRPHSPRLHRYVTEVMALRELHKTEIPRLRAGHGHTKRIAGDLLTHVFAPLGLPRDWLEQDAELCEIAVSPDGYFLRTSFDGAERVHEAHSELELRGWRSAFARCLETFSAYLHPSSGEAWLTVPDPAPDPTSPFDDLLVADLSICYPRADFFDGRIAVPRTGPAHRGTPREHHPASGSQTLVPGVTLKHPSGPVLRVSFLSPVWLSHASPLKPAQARSVPE